MFDGLKSIIEKIFTNAGGLLASIVSGVGFLVAGVLVIKAFKHISKQEHKGAIKCFIYAAISVFIALAGLTSILGIFTKAKPDLDVMGLVNTVALLVF